MKRKTIIRERLREAFGSVLPVSLIMLVLYLTVAPVNVSVLLAFLFGTAVLVLGMGLFTLGAEMSMTPVGEYVGTYITKNGKILPALAIAFSVGLIITLSEPDLQVLATQTPMIPSTALMITVGAGVGVFMIIAILRILCGIRLRYLLLGFYCLVFVLAQFVDRDFWAVAFDAGGVTTGPMTVPFIMALGVGVSALRNDRKAVEDTFGLVALCSIGPILAVMVLGILYTGTPEAAEAVVIPNVEWSNEIVLLFLRALPVYMKEVALAMGPVIVFFVILDRVKLKLRKRIRLHLAVGFVYTYIGLTLFLTGVNAGFMPAGYLLGSAIAGTRFRILLIPTGMLVGYYIVSAEPAVYILNHQVEELTSGAIPAAAMKTALSAGVCASVGISMLRVLTGISIMPFLIAGYGIALLLSFFVPDMFTAIAFDSGGVASGPMTATFLLPFAMGACQQLGANVVTDAFGIVAMVAMTPLVTIQCMGIVYTVRRKRPVQGYITGPVAEEREEIIDL